MNIFYTDRCPYTAATFLDDKRCVKMVLETAQILSTAMHLNNIEGYPYKPTHKHHPSVVWAAQNRLHFLWLCEHLHGLCREYTARYDKQHKCQQYLELFFIAVEQMPPGEFTEPPNCAANSMYSVSFKHIKDTTLAYKQYLNYRWENTDKNPTYKGVRI